MIGIFVYLCMLNQIDRIIKVLYIVKSVIIDFLMKRLSFLNGVDFKI